MQRLLITLTVLLFAAYTCVFLYMFDGGPPSGGQVAEVSVVINGPLNKYWDQVKRGMDQAASDLGAELVFDTLVTDHSAAEQGELIGRELDGGTKAFVIAPAAGDTVMKRVLGGVSEKAVIVACGSRMGSGLADASVSADNRAMGEALGERIVAYERFRPGILIITDGSGTESELSRLLGLTSVLSRAGARYSVRVVPPGTRDMAGRVAAYALTENARTVVALNSVTLTAAGEAFSANPHRARVYGADSSPDIVSLLEKRVITCVVAQNAYLLGYLSVESAVAELRGKRADAVVPVGCAVITANNMYTKEHERLLFPFGR
ncbi:MAG: substrate-binding domain-containing protein [Clostridiales bacterium]|nr:substrate-binding domain-containing protein [Clostridiales bacterium]